MPDTKVNLILGPAKSGKTHRTLERYAQFLDRWRGDSTTPLGVWIAPTPAAINDVRDRLAARSGGAFLHMGVMTFAMLADEILARGGQRIRSICSLEKLRILEQIVADLYQKGQLGYFTAVAQTPGFIRQVAAAIADLKRRGVRVEDFQRISREDRDRDVAAIYTEYEKHLLAHRLYDAEGRFWAACEALSRIATRSRNPGERSSPAKSYGLIAIDGFADFTSAQHELLGLLASCSEELLITLPADHDRANRSLLFDKPARTLDILEKSFPTMQRETASGRHFSSAGSEYVERELFRDEPGQSQAAPTDGLAIVAANSVQDEIREIAKRVKQLILSGRSHSDEIAVIFPSLAEVATRVEEVFEDFGLPVAIDNRKALASTPLARNIRKILELHVDDWPFEMLLDVTGNRNLQALSKENGLKAQGLQPLGIFDDLPAVERSIRRAQLPSGSALLLEQLRQWVNVDGANELSLERQRIVRDAQVALLALENLDKLLATLPSGASISDWLQSVERVAQSLGILNKGNSERWSIVRQNFAMVAQIDATFDGEPSIITARQFLTLFDAVSNQVLLPNRVDSIGRVRVLSAESARNLAVKHVFLAGLSEQSYSSAEGSRQLYREQDILKLSGEKTSDLAERRAGESMLLFYDMITRPSETLTLSYAALDDKGQSLPPSPYLTELERCVAPSVIPTFVMPTGENVQTKAEPSSRSDWRIDAVGAALEGDRQWLAGLISHPSTKPLGRALLRSIASIASRSDREIFGPFEGLLISEPVRAAIARRFDGEHLWSPSQLELYATCPYQFFARQILRLEPLQEIALRSDHLRRGNLLHQVLAAVHSQRMELSESAMEADLVQRFTTALENAISSMPLQGLERALLEIENREILALAAQYAEQEGNYGSHWRSWDTPPVPTHFEVRFGPKAQTEGTNDAVSTLVPFTLDLGTEKIKLTGQIDRIDMGQIGGVTVFNIIDYKSGKEVKLSDKEMIAGRQLQLPLYALAAERHLFADRNALAVATGYWSVKAGGFATGRDAVLEFRTRGDDSLVESQRWGKLNPEITRRVAGIIRGIRTAEFPVYNDNPKCTEYCEFSKICRVAHIRSLEKVWIPSQEITSTLAGSPRDPGFSEPSVAPAK